MNKKIQSNTRRNNKEGSIFQRKDGRWAGMATIGYNENGRIIRKCVYGKTRMDVANKLSQITNRIETETYGYIADKPIGTLMTEWLLIFKKNQVSPRTFENVLRNYQLHIESKIGNMKFDEVNHIVIQKVLNNMIDEGYSLAVVKKIKFIFNQFFEYAIENNFTTTNPTKKTRVKSVERKIYDSENRYKAIPPELRRKFLDCLNNHKFLKPFCLIMMFAGLRTGEALALRWENVDFYNKVIKIQNGVTTLPKFDENGKVVKRIVIVSDTKTACSVREVPMPEILANALLEYKENQFLKSQNLTMSNALVFGNNDGSIRTYSGTKKIFYRFLEKYGLDKVGIHFHGLRHTYSNMLFEANQNPKVIQGLLGHKSVKTTITTYNSVDKSYFKKATEILNSQFKVNENEDIKNLNDKELEEKIEELLKEKMKRRNEDF